MGSDPSGRFDLIAFSVRLSFATLLGGGIAVGINGIRNRAIGEPFFKNWLNAFMAGAALGAVATFAPWLAVAFGTLGVADSIDVAIKVFNNPASTSEQKKAALSYVAVSVAFLGIGAKYANSFGNASR